MKNKMGIIALALAVPASMFAQKKEDDRLAKSAAAIREILEGDNGLPASEAATGAARSFAARDPR